jgi:uncharacterized membrane protein
MESKIIHGRTVFMAVLFVASVFMLGIKLMNPTPIQIFVEGNETAVSQIPGFFTFTDGIILIISSIILSICGIYLLFFDSIEKPAGELVLGERKKRWEQTTKTLKNDEQKIYKAIIDSDGIIEQSALPEKTEISRSNVSRALDLLESRSLIEKRRRGMTNTILLK